MMCSQVQDLLPDYSVEMLDGRTSREVRAHLSECAGCRRELKAMDDVVALVEQYGAVSPPVGLFNGVRNQIEAGTVTREKPAWWAVFLTRPARVAAMGMAMGAVALGLFLPTSPTATIDFVPVHGGQAAVGSVASSELAGSIRQHAMSAGEGPLADRVAWEAMAQLVTQDREKEKSR